MSGSLGASKERTKRVRMGCRRAYHCAVSGP